MVCGSWNAKYGKCHKLGVEPWLSDQRQHPWIPTPCWKERPTESQRSGCHHQEESSKKVLQLNHRYFDFAIQIHYIATYWVTKSLKVGPFLDSTVNSLSAMPLLHQQGTAPTSEVHRGVAVYAIIWHNYEMDQQNTTNRS